MLPWQRRGSQDPTKSCYPTEYCREIGFIRTHFQDKLDTVLIHTCPNGNAAGLPFPQIWSVDGPQKHDRI